MAKFRSSTTQELYKARKHREEQEKESYLPPGLINHGNTCFMNSVLQGLIATRLLSDLVYFAPISPAVQRYSPTPIASRRSPQLTNGHSLGGEYERAWENTMPLGDFFLITMHKAWESQRLRRRESISPKPVLATLGKKYEQYLDFVQQDAHEFLRQLLDAMRMEELDVIKKRQPPPPPENHKKGRRTTITPSSVLQVAPSKVRDQESQSMTPIREDEQLMTLVDMIFGGKLTSILVCQKCKHVSQTYEDFNDLSLSIKADDYARERKRDRLKNLAKRLASFPGSSLGVGVGPEMKRSSSLPPSPRERDGGQSRDHYDPPIAETPRRRSFDIVAAEDVNSVRSVPKDDAGSGTLEGNGTATRSVSDDKHIGFAEPKTEPREKKNKKENDEGWAKLGRRISMTVGIGMGSRERKSRSRESHLRRSQDADVIGSHGADGGHSSEKLVTASAPTPDISDTAHGKDSTPAILLSRSSSSLERRRSKDRGSSPHLQTLSSTPNSLSGGSNTPHSRFTSIQRSVSPKPPKPSAAETEFLRHVLADVVPASSNPFVFFKPTAHQSTSAISSTGLTGNSGPHAWLKMTHMPGVEECLRMFTAVENLDGENMVGCRRCWKIANGMYNQREDGDGDSDSADNEVHPKAEEQEMEEPAVEEQTVENPTVSVFHDSEPASLPTSISTPILSLYSQTTSNSSASLSSLPTSAFSTPEVDSDLTGRSPSWGSDRNTTDPSNSLESRTSAAPGATTPLISATGPYSPAILSQQSTQHVVSAIDPSGTGGAAGSHGPHDRADDPTIPSLPDRTPNLDTPPSTVHAVQQSDPARPELNSRHSLNIPQPRRRGQRSDLSGTDESSEESEVSTAISGNSGDSSSSSVPNQTSSNGSRRIQPPAHKPRPKPVIMRPAYKRYLIATPPPVLVIHFKRFQQISKTHTLSFSNGFKKLDDYVTFPEYLDLTPFLAPRREDFGLGKKRKVTVKLPSKQAERCMYRLYAVVVHIGHMLGGHYVAYTALPNDTGPPSQKSSATLPASERQWAYISDTIVRLTTLEEVLKAKAYICMYERI